MEKNMENETENEIDTRDVWGLLVLLASEFGTPLRSMASRVQMSERGFRQTPPLTMPA